jgi:hypothetical protein
VGAAPADGLTRAREDGFELRRIELRIVDSSAPPRTRTSGLPIGRPWLRASTSDVIDASVVLIARRERAAVVSSDVDDLYRLDPRLVVHEI